MLRRRTILAVAGLFLLVHVGVLISFGTASPGPFVSDLIQLILGGLLIFSSIQASRRSEGLARSFWRLTATAYAFWFIAQGLSVYYDLFRSFADLPWISNLLFSFWFAPLAMAMFLDPEYEAGGLDPLVALDFAQAIIVCVAAYLYFFYLPKTEAGSQLAHSVWAPYFIGYTFVAASFLLRAVFSSSSVVRALFGRFGALLTLSGITDAMYYYGPGRNLKTGAWFDLLWSALIFLPLAFAESWKQQEDAPESSAQVLPPAKHLYTQMSYLLYPLLVLIMSVRIARDRLGLAATVVFLSFVCSSARLLVTQNRLVRVQEALRREASRDSLTGLWNRKVILETLDRELLRAGRHRETVGLIMADVDHFKAVNDSRGHTAGDLVLRIIASEIASGVRPYDSVGRYGGEEFLIVAPDCNLQQTWELAERIRNCVSSCTIVAGGSAVSVSLSLGIAVGTAAVGSEPLLQAADAALYQAKNAGRNRVEPSLGRAASASQNSSPATPGESKFWL